MNATGYKVLGFVVWKVRAVVWDGAKVYLRHRYGVRVPSRRVVGLATLTVGAGVVAAIVLVGRRAPD